MEDDVDVGQHIRLISRVIGQMNFPPSMVDEAFSEGLVGIVEAGRTFDPSYNVPLANWLAQNIRWHLAKWRAAQIPSIPIPEFHEGKPETFMSSELKEVFAIMDTVLTEQERQVILGTALGYKGVELAKALGVTNIQIHRIKHRATDKLKEAYHGPSV